MALNYVTLTLDLYDGSGNLVTQGVASLVPTVVLTDSTDHEIVSQTPIVVPFHVTGPPTVKLLATDNGNALPAGWAWTITPPAGIGMAPFNFFLPFSGGAAQFLSALSPVSSAVTMSAYLPLPGGTATAGFVPQATGTGESSVWASPGAASLPLTTLGDTLYENATPTAARLPGNTSATKNYLTQTGTGTVSAAPAWGTIAAGDVPVLNQSTTGNAASATNLAGGATLPAYLAPAVVALTDGATIAVNAALGNDFRVTLGGNRTMAAPTNPVDGQDVTFLLTQDGAGSRTVTWASGAGGYSFGSGSAPTLSTAAGKRDLVAFKYVAAATSWLCMGSAAGF